MKKVYLLAIFGNFGPGGTERAAAAGRSERGFIIGRGNPRVFFENAGEVVRVIKAAQLRGFVYGVQPHRQQFFGPLDLFQKNVPHGRQAAVLHKQSAQVRFADLRNLREPFHRKIRFREVAVDIVINRTKQRFRFFGKVIFVFVFIQKSDDAVHAGNAVEPITRLFIIPYIQQQPELIEDQFEIRRRKNFLHALSEL